MGIARKISRLVLRSSRELNETLGREMDWEQLHKDSKMREAIVGDTKASSPEQRLERFFL